MRVLRFRDEMRESFEIVRILSRQDVPEFSQDVRCATSIDDLVAEETQDPFDRIAVDEEGEIVGLAAMIMRLEAIYLAVRMAAKKPLDG